MESKNKLSKFVTKLEQKMLENNQETMIVNSISTKEIVGGLNHLCANDNCDGSLNQECANNGCHGSVNTRRCKQVLAI